MDWLHLERDLRLLEALDIDYLHYDIMDGFFVPEYSIGPFIINKIRDSSRIPSDYHLMIEEPHQKFAQFASDEGALVGIHYEACRNLHRDLMTLKRLKLRPGVVLNPATTLESIEYVIEEVDIVTVMTVNPGYAGQTLVPQVLNKVQKLLEWRRRTGLSFKVAVDGNVSLENIPKLVRLGVDFLVLGTSGLFVDGQDLGECHARVRTGIDAGLDAGELCR